MRKYDVIFIVKPMEEDATNAVIEKFSNLIQNNGGTIDKEDRWGKKRLAYEIKDCTEGFYCLFNVTCEPACVAECDRVMKITDSLVWLYAHSHWLLTAVSLAEMPMMASQRRISFPL